jgi:hypothetical protein
VRGNFGVRYVKTEQEATGPLQQGQHGSVAVTLGNGTVINETVPQDAIQTSREYTNTLPALNISAQPVRELLHPLRRRQGDDASAAAEPDPRLHRHQPAATRR